MGVCKHLGDSQRTDIDQQGGPRRALGSPRRDRTLSAGINRDHHSATGTPPWHRPVAAPGRRCAPAGVRPQLPPRNAGQDQGRRPRLRPAGGTQGQPSESPTAARDAGAVLCALQNSTRSQLSAESLGFVRLRLTSPVSRRHAAAPARNSRCGDLNAGDCPLFPWWCPGTAGRGG
jgi:hypothetical protein